MEAFLRKYGLVDNLTLRLKTDRQTFARKLAENVDFGGTDFFSGAFEAWKASNKDYVGMVKYKAFTIRKRRTFFQAQGVSMPVVNGTFAEDGEDLVIEAEIRTHTRFFIPALIFGLAAYLILMLVFAFSGSVQDSNTLFFIIPVMLLHMSLMLGLPLLIMKRGVARTKKDLKRDFFYIAHGGT